MVGSPVPFHGSDRCLTACQVRSTGLHQFAVTPFLPVSFLDHMPGQLLQTLCTKRWRPLFTVYLCTLLPSDGFAHQPRWFTGV